MIKKCLYIVIFIWTNFAFSSNFIRSDTIPKLSILENTYLFSENLDWSVRLVSNFKQQLFLLKNNNESLKYTPNNPFGIGVGIANQKLIIDILFNLKTNKEAPTTKFAAEGAALYKKNLITFTLENVHGYNVAGSKNDIDIFRDNISIFSIGLSYLHFLSKKDITVREMKSGLSALDKTTVSYGLGGFFIFNKLDANGISIIPPIEGTPYFNNQAEITKFSGYGGGLEAGVSSYFVLPAHFFASIYVAPGVGLEYKKVNTVFGSYEPSNLFIYKADVFASLGYNRKKYYINFTFFNSFYSTNLNYNNKALLNITKSKLIFGYNIGKIRFKKQK